MLDQVTNAPIEAIHSVVAQLGFPIFEGTFIPQTTSLRGPLVNQDDNDYQVTDDDLTGFDRIDDKPWYQVFTTTKYILNIIFIAVPWTVFGLLNIAWNVWLNIYFNKGWAGANIWLMANTAYLCF